MHSACQASKLHSLRPVSCPQVFNQKNSKVFLRKAKNATLSTTPWARALRIDGMERQIPPVQQSHSAMQQSHCTLTLTSIPDCANTCACWTLRFPYHRQISQSKFVKIFGIYLTWWFPVFGGPSGNVPVPLWPVTNQNNIQNHQHHDHISWCHMYNTHYIIIIIYVDRCYWCCDQLG